MDKREIKEILDNALSQGGDFAEIFIEHKETTGIICESGKIEKINTGIDYGAGIRVISGEKTAYGYTNALSFDKLMAVAAVASKVAQGRQKETVLDFTTPAPILENPVEMQPDKVKLDDKIAQINFANQAAREQGEGIKQVTVSYADKRQNVIIANSKGTYVEDERVTTRFACNAIAGNQQNIQTGLSSVGGTVGFELFKTVDAANLGQKAATTAINLLSAKPCPAGKMTVVMASEAGGTMVHEACGHGLEADLVQRGMSIYADRVGEKVASEEITVIDDATMPGKYGSYRYDDEGTVGRKNVLIKDGVLEQYMSDYHTAEKIGKASTGNGRRESYQCKPVTRMTNTYIAPGKHKPEDIIRSTESGLYVTKMGGGQVDTTTGDYVFDVAEGYLIENGEITTAVKGATLAGNGPESLQNVEMVGNDLEYIIGTCGKEGQGVPVSDAQPTLKIGGLVVGGTGHGDCQLSREFTIKRV